MCIRNVINEMPAHGKIVAICSLLPPLLCFVSASLERVRTIAYSGEQLITANDDTPTGLQGRGRRQGGKRERPCPGSYQTRTWASQGVEAGLITIMGG